MKESPERDVVRSNEGGEREKESKEESPSSSHKAQTPFFDSVSSPDSKGDYYDVPSSVSTSPPHAKDEGLQEKKCAEPFFSCFEPFMRKFEENLHNEFAYLDKLQNLCNTLQEENKSLRGETEQLKEFIFSSKLSQSIGEQKEIAKLHNKIHALQAALRIELLKVDEYKKEIDDARHVLMRRTRAKMKKGQMFEVILAQKPQEVPMASCAIPFQEDTNVGACPICLEEFDVASGWYTLNCNHRYHLVCLAKVMPTRTRCCVCNQELHKLLYEIFGMANTYPDDARLWDAQTGHPVDFTAEEDIRAVVNELEQSQEETDPEEDEAEEITMISRDYVSDEHSEIAEDSQADGDHDVRDASQASAAGLDEEEGEGATDEDREDDEEDEGTINEDGEYNEESTEEGSFEVTSSSEEEDDADDPDYTPSQ